MTRPLILGLTGSIGMGKSTTAAMFAAEGIPVWDADAAVHRLYAPGGAAVAAVAALCPDALDDGGIDRGALKHWIASDDTALARLEKAVHPLVARDRAAFICKAREDGKSLVILDIPLLFETGADAGCDQTLVVTASPEVQQERVLARPGMTRVQLDSILARQMPDAEKRARATHVIETRTLDQTRADVRALIQRLIPEE
ncbi:dephospho-CoA kinase [Rhodobacteraceae bacterium 2376]|uniref:Dephospho-CoA kinase n=1 Tax=Rhabdonatronobacter sediminivivens TaxID=2743469 RepID=A0A7Z0HX35_9RHOB|nr:dephospho-CoA kinase [Rhabdonatronobacter sediminivivens]NYS23755.1 dephospho-CoA kinase [Rhabdonatronobacter sediminivivens]